MTTNPYGPPAEHTDRPKVWSGRRIAKVVGTVILTAGLIVLAYGAVAFWIIPALPPNGGPSGRLSSSYVMGIGIAAMVVGLAVRDLRLPGWARGSSETRPKGIPTSIGMLVLLAIAIAVIVAIARL